MIMRYVFFRYYIVTFLIWQIWNKYKYKYISNLRYFSDEIGFELYPAPRIKIIYDIK